MFGFSPIEGAHGIPVPKCSQIVIYTYATGPDFCPRTQYRSIGFDVNLLPFMTPPTLP